PVAWRTRISLSLWTSSSWFVRLRMRSTSLGGSDAVEQSRRRLIGASFAAGKFGFGGHLAHPTCTNSAGDFVGPEFCSSRERHHFFPAGTFCFNSSNQFSTTLICAAACTCSFALTIRKRWPSGDTS